MSLDAPLPPPPQEEDRSLARKTLFTGAILCHCWASARPDAEVSGL